MADKLNTYKWNEAVKGHWTTALYPQLQQYCRFLTRSQWDGEDLAQDTLLKAYKYYHHEQTIQPKLLKKIAYHQWVDTIRKRKHEALDYVPERIGMEKEARHVVQMEIVESFLKQLTPKQALVFVLKEAFQFQLREIAELLHTTETAVKAILHRAKGRLDKTDDDKKTHCAESSWNLKENKLLLKLIYQSFYSQDPTLLIGRITAVRSLQSKAENPKLALFARKEHSVHPSCEFLMAA